MESQFKVSHVTTEDQSGLVSRTHLGQKTRFLLLSDICWFFYIRRPLWREDGSVVYNCYWSSPAQSFSGSSSAGFMIIFYCLRFETFPTWRARSPYLYPEEQGGPVIPPDTGFPFRRLLRLEVVRWRYSNPSPRGESSNWKSKSKSKLWYNRRFSRGVCLGIKHPSAA
jgi:hypothetical protein